MYSTFCIVALIGCVCMYVCMYVRVCVGTRELFNVLNLLYSGLDRVCVCVCVCMCVCTPSCFIPHSLSPPYLYCGVCVYQLAEEFGVYKIDIIGDAYVCAAGLVDNAHMHTQYNTQYTHAVAITHMAMGMHNVRI